MADTAPVNPRTAIREKREQRLRVIDGPPKTLKVYAANETYMGLLRHPSGASFRSLDEAAEWPNDTFTHRRIADGSLLTDGPGSGEALARDPTKNAREHAAAQRPESKAAPKLEQVKSSKPKTEASVPTPPPAAA